MDIDKTTSLAHRFTGERAVEYAGITGAILNKYADPTEGARSGLSIAEAEAVIAEDPSLIWCAVPRAAFCVGRGRS